MKNQKFIEHVKNLRNFTTTEQLKGTCIFNTEVEKFILNSKNGVLDSTFLLSSPRLITFVTENDVKIDPLTVLPDMARIEHYKTGNIFQCVQISIHLKEVNVKVIIRTGAEYPHVNQYGEFIIYQPIA